jgi:D-serine deaminase-like pyridoxal phosphate-dependent protein
MSYSNPTAWKGRPLVEVDTPSLMLDADALRANLDFMANYFADRHCKLRPHFKSHKCTHLAKLQLQSGAIGITCAKLGEAEVLADAGIRNILIANEIVGPVKIARLVELARRADPIVAVDCEPNIRELSAAAVAGKVTIGILVEVNLGLNRCGVPAGEPALALAKLAASLPGLKYLGLQGYEGHIIDLPNETERGEKACAAFKTLVDTRRMIEGAGIPVKIVSGGGTGTYTFTGNVAGVDELQAGSYAGMDWYYRELRPEFQQAMSMLVTVISRPKPDVAIIDVGRKGVGAEFGPPRIKTIPGAVIANFTSEEHATVKLPEASDFPRVGDKIEIIPSHGCTTSNLHHEYIVHRNGVVEDVWPIEGSGKLR